MPNSIKRAEIRETGGIEVQRPAFAFACIEEITSPADQDNYKSYVKNMPAYIQSNGLGQTLGFMYAKSGSGVYGTLLKQIYEYMIFRQLIAIDDNEYNHENFIRAVICFDPFKYYQATDEVFLLIDWLRKFAEGKFGGGNQP